MPWGFDPASHGSSTVIPLSHAQFSIQGSNCIEEFFLKLYQIFLDKLFLLGHLYLYQNCFQIYLWNKQNLHRYVPHFRSGGTNSSVRWWIVTSDRIKNKSPECLILFTKFSYNLYNFIRNLRRKYREHFLYDVSDQHQIRRLLLPPSWFHHLPLSCLQTQDLFHPAHRPCRHMLPDLS